MNSENFLIKLQEACEENNLSPAELVHYVMESKNTFNLTKRNLLRVGAGVGLLGAVAGSAFAAPTDQGQISAQSGQFAKVEGPSDSTVIDLSGDIVDLSNTEQMVLPIYSGTPGSLSTGSMWLDSSI
tara:strand:+ start:653 stop:1033 length:381 start_codon:yes stop_codon:yes gene_type:complete